MGLMTHPYDMIGCEGILGGKCWLITEGRVCVVVWAWGGGEGLGCVVGSLTA